MEQVTRRIRLEALAQAGISADEEEKRLHNLIRSPYSIHLKCDLMGIEAWLVKLAKHFPEPEAKRVVALQWVRACIRAAPLGREMWRLFRASPLSRVAGDDWATLMDLRILAGLRLDYRSRAFELLRRFGVSA